MSLNYKHINQDGTMVTITKLETQMAEHKTVGCSHPFEGDGVTIPSNAPWPLIECKDEGSEVPGYSITEAHWEKDKLFEARLMTYYARMCGGGFSAPTMESFLKEYRDACNGIRVNNKHHLERIHNKAYKEIYGGEAWDQPDSPAREQDMIVKTLLAAEGVLRG